MLNAGKLPAVRIMHKIKKPIKDEDRVIKDPERSKRKTFDRAVNLLTFRPRSTEELRARLLEKVWTNDEIVSEVIEKLKRYNYLNDEEYAYAFASSKLRRKAIGKRRLSQDLFRKKLDKDVIKVAVDRAFDETPEEGLIDRAIDKRLRTKGHPETHNDKQNFFGYLVRLGFEYDLIQEKIREFQKAKPEQDVRD